MKRLLILVVMLAGCGEAAPTTGDGGTMIDPGGFVPFARDFAPYPGWTSFMVDGPPIGPIHTMGPRTVYINNPPTAGATAFPVGTLIVKTMQGGDIFAMAKRGGAYNTKGAVGWEWLELKQLDTGLAIVWRGIAPPAGACYGAIVGGACNDCHSGAPNNDYVLTPALRLGAH